MITIESLKEYALQYKMPLEDVLFTALNFSGVNMDVAYKRMRTAFHLNEKDNYFKISKYHDDLNYYLALPINYNSPFRISNGKMFINDYFIGYAIGVTEDFCDSHYPRRLGTSLNINPNSRTSCRGCDFCYTAYQIPLDKKKLSTYEDLVSFFDEWIERDNKSDLSHLIQVSVVTGCYDDESTMVDFLLLLSDVLKQYGFKGKIFYLGSMLCNYDQIQRLKVIPSFGYCVSIECFERRDLLKTSKRSLSLDDIKQIMKWCIDAGFEVNYTYVLGLEPLDVMEKNMKEFLAYTNKFPTINILQIHQQHSRELLDKTVIDLNFFLLARKIIEKIYKETNYRPLVWEDYRSLWYLQFADEHLSGIRFPSYFWGNKINE